MAHVFSHEDARLAHSGAVAHPCRSIIFRRQSRPWRRWPGRCGAKGRDRRAL